MPSIRTISLARTPTTQPPSPAPEVPPWRITAWITSLPFLSLHLVGLGVLFTGMHTLDLLLCAACYGARMFGITAGYHRYFAHRSYKTSRPFQFVMACLGCSALQKGPLWWAAHHRHHHRHSDTTDDPHSPHARSIWWSHIGWVLSTQSEPTDHKAVRDWVRFPELRYLNRLHWLPGIALALVCWAVGGWSGLVWGFVVSTILLYHAVFAVNSVCHLLGRRRYPTNDQSRNNLFVALITLGEGWHNNHHYYQSSANQGFFWWEVDMSYYMIRALSWFGLVWGVRKPPRKVFAAVRGRLANAIGPGASPREARPAGSPG